MKLTVTDSYKTPLAMIDVILPTGSKMRIEAKDGVMMCYSKRNMFGKPKLDNGFEPIDVINMIIDSLETMKSINKHPSEREESQA